MRRPLLLLLALVSAMSLWALPLAPAQEEVAVRGMITPATQDAIDRGLAYLATRQSPDGSFGEGNRGMIAYTSLSGLAFMAGGHQPGRGKYGHVVRKALENVLSLEDAGRPGYLHNPATDRHGPMYGHGFAMLFLGEVHGMANTPELRKRVRDTLGRAVELTIKSQNRQGGWRYTPDSGDADVSATICQIKALRSARNAGFSVPKSVADRCIKYVKDCQDPATGGFRYQPNGGPPGFARTAAGIDALYSSGLYESKELEQAIKFLMKFKPGAGGNPGGGLFNFETQIHYHYGHYYAAQALWIAGGDPWKEWYPAIRNELITTQRADGGWSSNQFGSEYATAMSLIILQIPNRYLPILQR